MLKTKLIFIACFYTVIYGKTYAQETIFKGVIIDEETLQPMSGVSLTLENTSYTVTTNNTGIFYILLDDTVLGEQLVRIQKLEYTTKRIPVTINSNTTTDLGHITLKFDMNKITLDMNSIQLSDGDLDHSNPSVYTIPNLLQASKDTFLNAAAFDFNTAFYKPRGIGSTYSKVLLNGIEMNTLSHGKPDWNTWGGLNDVQRNQDFAMGLSVQPYSFGDLSSTTVIEMRASQAPKGIKVAYASSNRSYMHRAMATYNSGLRASDWAYTVSASRRFGKTGYIEGTVYDAYAVFAAVEKKWSAKHATQISGWYTPSHRGMSTAITKEVYELKGNTYNPNWGYQNGKPRNARMQVVKKPILMLHHYWNPTKRTALQMHIAFQGGTTSRSRIDTGGTDLFKTDNDAVYYAGGGHSSETNPMYYHNLPSFSLQNEVPTALSYQNAFLAEHAFRTDGQLDWERLTEINQRNTQEGRNATYAVYDDKTVHKGYDACISVQHTQNERWSWQGALTYKREDSKHYAQISDLLGGQGFLDIDRFVTHDDPSSITEKNNAAQSNLRTPNRIVTVGDRYKYHYMLNATRIGGFMQGQYKTKHMDVFCSGTASETAYQRHGFFEHGFFPGEDSYGKGSVQRFLNYGIKAGLSYRINWQHEFQVHSGYVTKAPTIAQTYIQPRQQHHTVSDLLQTPQHPEKITTIVASYQMHTATLKAKLTGYYTTVQDASHISMFYTQSILGTQPAFVQQALTGIDKQYIGGELGIEYLLTPTLTLKGVVAIGQHAYANTPNLTLNSTGEALRDSGGVKNMGASALRNYRLSEGPQHVAQLGIQYRDPNFWWLGITANYFSHAYIAVSPLARTSNYIQDVDGLPFNNYDATIAKQLLQQERLTPYLLVNATLGKSWRIRKTRLGVFASVQNILQQQYRTGGFESSRIANYRLQLEETRRTQPIHGTRYFYGPSTQYFLNVSIRF